MFFVQISNKRIDHILKMPCVYELVVMTSVCMNFLALVKMMTDSPEIYRKRQESKAKFCESTKKSYSIDRLHFNLEVANCKSSLARQK